MWVLRTPPKHDLCHSFGVRAGREELPTLSGGSRAWRLSALGQMYALMDPAKGYDGGLYGLADRLIAASGVNTGLSNFKVHASTRRPSKACTWQADAVLVFRCRCGFGLQLCTSCGVVGKGRLNTVTKLGFESLSTSQCSPCMSYCRNSLHRH